MESISTRERWRSRRGVLGSFGEALGWEFEGDCWRGCCSLAAPLAAKGETVKRADKRMSSIMANVHYRQHRKGSMSIVGDGLGW